MQRPVSACALAAILVGCAGSSAHLKSDNEQLETKVAELRAETRVQRRTIRDLENQVALLAGSTRATQTQADVPKLPVEVRRPASPKPSAGPQEFASSGVLRGRTQREREGRDEDDDEVIVLTNLGAGASAGSDRKARSRQAERQRRRELRADSPVPTSTERLPEMGGRVPTVASRLGDDSRDPDREQSRREPRADYRRYLEALRAGNHAFAIAGFRNFVGEHGEHDLADNAQYWLAEAYYDQDDFDTALAEFRKVVTAFPGGGKVPDAMLKIGFCHIELGDEDAARRVLRRVAERFSDTNPARLAADRLESLGN